VVSIAVVDPLAPAVEPVKLIAWSDYLCPWCYNASVRLERLEQEFAGRVEIEWRSYLLRPHPGRHRDLEQFRAYTQSWLRPAAEQDSGEFRPWQGDAGPPSHSVPPHQVAKAAGSLSADAFRRMHQRLMRAYFCENQDITDRQVLRKLWLELDLPESDFERWRDPAILEQILNEYNQAMAGGATGVPAVSLEGNDAIIVGAHPIELYRRWVKRTLSARSRAPDVEAEA